MTPIVVRFGAGHGDHHTVLHSVMELRGPRERGFPPTKFVNFGYPKDFRHETMEVMTWTMGRREGWSSNVALRRLAMDGVWLLVEQARAT